MDHLPKEYTIRIISQFLKENDISIDELKQEEELLSHNNLKIEELIQVAKEGKWDIFLESCPIKLSDELLICDIYEHIFRCLTRIQDFEAAKILLERSNVLGNYLRRNDSNRYLILKRILDRKEICFMKEGEEEKERINLVTRLEYTLNEDQLKYKSSSIVKSLEPQQLLNIIQDATKWRHLCGKRLAEWNSYEEEDIIVEDKKRKKSFDDDEDIDFTKPKGVHSKFGKGITVQSSTISADGETFATGTSDGFIELWHVRTMKSRKDLPYQANDEPLFVDFSVSCLAFSLSNEYLASGDISGVINIFRVSNGALVKTIESGHSKGGVSCISMSPDSTKLVSGGCEGVCRIFSIASGSKLCELIGHESFVNTIEYISTTRIISGSSDEKVYLWNALTGEQLHEYGNFYGKINKVIPVVNSIVQTGPPCYLQFGEMNSVLICSVGAVSCLDTQTGGVNTIFQRPGNNDLVTMSISRSGKYIFCGLNDERSILVCHRFDNKMASKPKVEKLTSSKLPSKLTSLISICTSPTDEFVVTVTWGNCVSTFL